MLLEQTFEQLTALQLHGMVEALHRFADTAPWPTSIISPQRRQLDFPIATGS
jgi:hypothetical protein